MNTTQNSEATSNRKPNYMAYFMECAGRLNDPRAQEYLKHHGINQEIAKAAGLGFDPEADPEAAPGALDGSGAVKQNPCARLIVPCGPSNYTGYRIEPAGDGFDSMNPFGSTPGIFDGSTFADAQDTQEVLFVTEGIFDALAVVEAGAAAVALNGKDNIRYLLAAYRKKPSKKTLILCMNNNDQGQATREKLVQGLLKQGAEVGADFITINICGKSKTPNAALIENRESFISDVQAAIEAAGMSREQRAKEQREAEEQKVLEEQKAQEVKRQEYLQGAAAARIPAFESEIRDRASVPAISTGFYSLDQILDGGLYEGLYIMGAISSLGKTTFALQLMDNIAQGGRDVLIFSLEMATSELMAKSISRQTFALSGGKPRDAKTTRGILAGSRYANYSKSEQDLIRKATEKYREYAGRIFITEGIGNVGVLDIKKRVEKHIDITGRAPVVLIDYLQLLAPSDPRYSDKQNTDRAVLALKQLSRDRRIPVVAISSFNRNSYTDPVNMAAFKESGAIEYSSDVLIGLQYDGMDYQDGEAEKAREKRIRDLLKNMENTARDGGAQQIQVKILKNRNGIRGSVAFTYRPIFNYFSDGMDAEGFAVMDEAEQLQIPIL